MAVRVRWEQRDELDMIHADCYIAVKESSSNDIRQCGIYTTTSIGRGIHCQYMHRGMSFPTPQQAWSERGSYNIEPIQPSEFRQPEGGSDYLHNNGELSSGSHSLDEGVHLQPFDCDEQAELNIYDGLWRSGARMAFGDTSLRRTRPRDTQSRPDVSRTSLGFRSVDQLERDIGRGDTRWDGER